MNSVEQLAKRINNKIFEETGEKTDVQIHDADRRNSEIRFSYGWKLSYSLDYMSLGSSHPRQGLDCGSPAGAQVQANERLSYYQSGRDDRFIRKLREKAPATVDGFRQGNMNLGNDGQLYFGSESCSGCHGRGENTCYSCTNGSTMCNTCYGRGTVQEMRYINNQNQMVTNTCNSCGGRGKINCYACYGKGKTQCSTCSGSGKQYSGFYISVSAKRGSSYSIQDPSPHHWTELYVRIADRQISNFLSDISIKEVADRNYTIAYEMQAVLPTLECNATIPAGTTGMQLIGRQDHVINAGCIMDATVWERAINLGHGDYALRDRNILNMPAVEEMLRKHESDEDSALVGSRWISEDVYEAVVDKYESFVGDLKKNNKQGLWKTVLGGYFMVLLAFVVPLFLIGIFIPEAAVGMSSYLRSFDISDLHLLNLHETVPYHISRFPYGGIGTDDLFIWITGVLIWAGLLQTIHKKKRSKMETTFHFLIWFWLCPYMYRWGQMMVELVSDKFGKPTEFTHVEWYKFGLEMLIQNWPQIVTFSIATAFVLISWRYWQKKDTAIKQYRSDILSARFSLKTE
ncbi:hypothetical protein [Parendozoicomonas haliclonae]|uniref:CR-type domain-containing protein n=1 Tax=Parendozoicomonas haliclonae TaxID=1960125 RepID=A0A1X7AE26_9GAMM|nr:hypothetical protein [Parendozoicomonas haliclonae]SMA32917.1 hypothetical protein EHSB41UT_00206 [Parendozoicomonas haliclonae]